jgi:hypothetical protein
MDKSQFDVMLPVAVKDVANLDLNLDKIYTNLKPRKIIVVANKEVKNLICENQHVEFCDEDELVENLTLNNIKSCMISIVGNSNRSGWYFQQFLKMAYAIKSELKYYLIWDSDTIPLNNINFFNFVERERETFIRYEK